jgi:transcriptional regulator with XRE-family HTH domain
MDEVAVKLKEWRESRGWTAQRLAAELGVQTSTITRWERGERRIPARFLESALMGLRCEQDHGA